MQGNVIKFVGSELYDLFIFTIFVWGEKKSALTCLTCGFPCFHRQDCRRS